jgi:ATP-binding protein involved in chromosome partitioning
MGLTPRSILGVIAGKGGVGKSTLCLQMARAAQALGWKVGVLDADIHGPSMHQLAPLTVAPSIQGDRVLPGDSAGLAVISTAHLPRWGEAAVVRAPIANALIEQFLFEVDWEGIDLLFIDFPPGTGDVPITLMQRAKLQGLIAVTTPQSLAVADVKKALHHARESNIPIMGLIENMAGLSLADGSWVDLFGESQSHRLLHEFAIGQYLQLAFHPRLAGLSERGGHLFEAGLQSRQAEPLVAFVQELLDRLDSVDPADRLRQPAGAAMRLELTETSLSLCAPDGSCRRIDAIELLQSCPCICCQSARAPGQGVGLAAEHPGPPRNGSTRTSAAQGRARLLGASPMGTYGITIKCESGCSRGIYSWELLSTLGTIWNSSGKLEPAEHGAAGL